MSAVVQPIVRLAGKGRQPAAVERIRDLEEEVVALTAERETVGTEVRALSARLQLAIRADRPDIGLHVAGRLDALAAALLRRGPVAA